MTGTVATVGTFDGVQRGHQAVLAEIVRRARARGLASLVVTFDPHPLEVVNPAAAPRLLTLPDEKREIVAALGLDRVELVPFTTALARLAPEQFVRNVLRAQYGMRSWCWGMTTDSGGDGPAMWTWCGAWRATTVLRWTWSTRCETTGNRSRRR